MLKMKNKSSQKFAQNLFLDDILADNPGTKKLLKDEKNSKKRLLGPLSRSKLCENGPEIV
jgi:hypothetical protein